MFRAVNETSKYAINSELSIYCFVICNFWLDQFVATSTMFAMQSYVKIQFKINVPFIIK